MGDLIHLDERRAGRLPGPRAVRPGGRPAPREARPKFYFDPACPLSYLSAELVERTLGDVDWVPVSAAEVSPVRNRDAIREHATTRAGALRLPLVWPDWFPAEAPRALRAAAYASEVGAGRPFALAASRLAFCGGFELDDPETLTEAAAAAGVPLAGCLEAAADARRDRPLDDTAAQLRERAIVGLPAIELGGRLLDAEPGLIVASMARRQPLVNARLRG